MHLGLLTIETLYAKVLGLHLQELENPEEANLDFLVDQHLFHEPKGLFHPLRVFQKGTQCHLANL